MTATRTLSCLSIIMVIAAACPAAIIPTTDLVLWVRADQDVLEGPADPAESGDNVTDWLDQSASGNDLAHSPVVAGNFTQYLTGQVNGQPALQFNDGNDRLQAPGEPLITGTGDFSIFALVNTRAFSDSGAKVIASNWGPGTGNTLGLELITTGSKPQIHIRGVSLRATSLVPTGYYLMHAERVSGFVTLRINNEVVVSGTAAGNIDPALPWTIGSGANYAGSAFGLLAEQIVYTDSLSRTERNQVLAYLETKYNVGIVPEPGTMALLVVGAAACLRRARLT